MKMDGRFRRIVHSKPCMFLFVPIVLLCVTLFFILDAETVDLLLTFRSISGQLDVPGEALPRNSEEENSNDESAEYLLARPVVEEGEEDVSYDPAPRTTTQSYNVLNNLPGARYFLYSPSGGLSNQLLEIGYALEICRLLNRSLIVPMIGRHSSGWRLYEHLPYSDLFPADRILDFSRLTAKVPCVPLNISVENFAALFARTEGTRRMRLVYHPDREGWTKSDLIGHLGYEKRKLVYLRGAEMFHQWFPHVYMLPVRKHIRFAESLRMRAMKMVQETFPDGKFNAMHIRLADYAERWGTFQERTRAITSMVLNEKFNKSIPIYLASDEPNNGGFTDLKRMYTVVTSDKLPKQLMEDFKNLFPKSRIRYDMIGVLEQLICAQAKKFLGTGWSTFSENIEFIRTSKAKMFPELIPPVKEEEPGAGQE